MIPLEAIRAWRAEHPWPDDDQVEQDLVISRALVELFSDSRLERSLAFRGGTALHKLVLSPAARHSVDIDLVQVSPAGIGPTLDAVRERLSPWLGTPSSTVRGFLATMKFRYQSGTGTRQTLKIEINTREHGSVYELERLPLVVENPWFRGETKIQTYSLEELLATKMRALYRRDAGRDVFDIVYALGQRINIDRRAIVSCYLQYEANSGLRVSRRAYEDNLRKKRERRSFLADIEPLLGPDFSEFDMVAGIDRILGELVPHIPE